MFKILAQSMKNCGSQGKNRVSVITQSTLGSGVIKKLFSKKEDIGKKQANFQF
jgi:hypothetical protein